MAVRLGISGRIPCPRCHGTASLEDEVPCDYEGCQEGLVAPGEISLQADMIARSLVAHWNSEAAMPLATLLSEPADVLWAELALARVFRWFRSELESKRDA